MSKFHIMHCIPHPRMHGLNGYKEVIESLQWGLEQLGHQVNYAVNEYGFAPRNIVLGAQVMSVEQLAQLPADTIIYNFEQLRGVPKDLIKPALHHCAQHFQIWDYSEANMEAWQLLGAKQARLVPVGYAPVLTRIPKFDVQDIDVLIYGMSGDKRLDAYHSLSQSGLRVVFASGLYGQARDMLIARAKIVLNINLYDFARIFEIVRVSYLFANQKAVVATWDEGTAIEPGLEDCIRFSDLENIAQDCDQLLANDAERTRLERAGFDHFARRDIRQILKTALA